MTQIDNIQVRRNTAAAAYSSNPTLNAGEIGFETDTNQVKIGDGTTAWNDLGYIGKDMPDGTVLGNTDSWYQPLWDASDNVSITGLTGTGKWAGGVLAPNGKIYCVPRNSTSVLIIDPATDTAETTSITGLTETGKWAGGVLAPNGKIYCVPYFSTSVLIIDPATDTAETTSITGLTGTDKWYGGVLAPNGKIYCVPYNSTSVLIVSPGFPTLPIAPLLSPYINKF